MGWQELKQIERDYFPKIGPSISGRELIARVIICASSKEILGFLQFESNEVWPGSLNSFDISEEQGNFIIEEEPARASFIVSEATSSFHQLLSSVPLDYQVHELSDPSDLTYHKLAQFSVLG